jgi:hypothetical protein
MRSLRYFSPVLPTIFCLLSLGSIPVEDSDASKQQYHSSLPPEAQPHHHGDADSAIAQLTSASVAPEAANVHGSVWPRSPLATFHSAYNGMHLPDAVPFSLAFLEMLFFF